MCCNGFININISTDVFRIFALNMILMLAIMITTVARKSNKLCYDITGEYNLDLISSISKYATCILNDGEGGYIKWRFHLQRLGDINDVVSAMRSEISKIKPVVHETKYQFTHLQQTGVLIEIAPVPWGLEAYAAPDGHVYIAGVAEDLANENQANSEIKHENNIETQDDIAMETSDYWVGLTSGSISKAEEKETGMLPCEIKSIIDDCVQDLRDIKSTLGIHSTLERPAKEEINTLAQQKSSTKKKLHHCKSQSDQLYNESQQSVRHWKSDPVVSDISGSNGFKTLCEDIPFSPCRDGKPLPSTSSKLLQVDGEGRGDVGDGLDTSDYVLPQLDGVYDQNIVKEESNSGSEAYKWHNKSSFVIFWLGLVLVALVQYGSGQIVVPIPYPGNYYMRYPYQYSSSYISEAKNAGVLAFVSNHGTDDVVKATSNYYAEQLLHNVYTFKDIRGTFLVGIWDWDWSLSNIQFQKVSKPYAKAWTNKYLHIVLNDLSMDLTGDFDAHSKHRLFEGRGKLYAHVCFHLQVTFSIGLHNTVQVEQCYAGFECPTNIVLNMNTDYPNFVNDWIQDKMQTHLKAQMLCDGLSKFATDYQVYHNQWAISDSNNPATAKCGNAYHSSYRIQSNDTNKNALPERAIALCNKEQLVHCRTTNRGMPTSVTTYVY